MAQIQEVQEREIRAQNLLSPISEKDSNKFNTLDSHGQTIRRINPDEERKLTGTGSYNIDKYEYDHDNDYYSDDFESDYEDDEESGQTAVATGCSGSTLDSL